MSLAAQVGPYRIVERLGAGGMGEVFLAEDTRLGRRVALKTVAASGAAPADGRRHLLREARAAARLNHPNIAAIYDVIDSGEDAHIVMEYVAGETLASRVARGPLGLATVVEMGRQLADALAEAHAAGIVHRDLKPANIALTQSGNIKVLDFGLAQSQLFDLTLATGPLSLEDVAKPRAIMGTPQYISPEHLMGRPVDERSDIYSLGVTLYELLTGARPFGGADLVSLASAVLHAPTPSARTLRPDVPPRLDAAITRAMARDPAARWASALELRDELQRVASELTSEATRELSPARPTRWRLVAAAAIFAAVASGLAFRAGSWRAPGPPAAIPSTSTVVAVMPFTDGPGVTEPLGAGVSDLLTATLARVSGLSVVARSALRETGAGGTVPAAQRLGANLVVEGRIEASGTRLRLIAQLVEAGSGRVAWAGSWEASREELFEVQRKVASELASALAPAQPGPPVAAAPPTSNHAAFAAFARGWTLLDRPDVAGNPERAVEAFAAAVSLDPRFARAHAALGEACWRLYETTRHERWSQRARESLTEALRLDPQDAAVRVALGSLYASTGRRAEALEEADRALALQPSSDAAHALRGELLFDAGRAEEGLSELRTAQGLRPGHGGHRLKLGTLLFEAGRYDEALAELRDFTARQPDSAWGFQMLGTVHHFKGDLPAAIDAYRKAIAVGADARAWANLGTAYYELGRLEEAADAYRRAAEGEPTSFIARQNLGDVLRRLGRAGESEAAYEHAVSLASEALAIDPRDARTAALRAGIEAKLGRRALAARHLAEALAMAPPSGEVLHVAAQVHALAGERAEALDAVQRALATGYSVPQLRADEFLAAIHDDPRFVALVSTPSTGGNQP
jgi:serine/threonine protein kinase/tetratricopeptide (TPR) repeat protein